MPFSQNDGDAWWRRNSEKVGLGVDPVIQAIKDHDIFPKKVFEIGCANGWRLKLLREQFGCECWGCDISHEAIAANVDKENRVYWREATRLKQIPQGFDMVIYGFCLYVCDPKDLFRIANEGDRILKNEGHLVIHDFLPEHPHSRIYRHDPDLRSNKMDYAKLWLANPAYSLVSRRVYPHEHGEEITEDTRTAVTILRKNLTTAFSLKS